MSTTGRLNDAWAAYMTAVNGSDPAALASTRETLYAAAQAHAAEARPAASIARYFAAVNADPDADPADVQEVAQELDAARRANAILDGAWPGTAPTVSTGG